eukprot:CAMPEP_0170172406 /NCGR_PEP_ID=MMETSP0040_2-20121228/5636_1 /TAXON_ID=641309 /ORGANISM="Lotharella oceanica, Strain CCMP622" /LENGTH=362 /DNA_ID=CAMNT_0010413049 /DNA_START=26 /DNA_END=1114 /DNA_ORIENTATION=+
MAGERPEEIGEEGKEDVEDQAVTMPMVQATPVVRTDAGDVPADAQGQPIQGAEPIHPQTVQAYRAQGSHGRNCCENRACLWTFWLIVAGFIITSFIVGFVTKRPWLGALGVLSIIPAAIILYIVYWKNHKTQVELPRVVNMFCWGVIGAIPCAFLELLLTFMFAWATGYNTKNVENGDREPVSHVVIYSLFAAFFVAALCEESLKYYLVVEFPNGTKNVRTAYGIVVLATAGALGFATLENIGYVFQDSSSSSFAVAIMRALLAVPLHAATGMIIGLSIAKALMDRTNPICWKVLWLPILLHGTYDGLLMLSLGLKHENPDIQNLGIVAFLIPIFALSYGVRQIYKLPPEYFAGEANQRLLA